MHNSAFYMLSFRDSYISIYMKKLCFYYCSIIKLKYITNLF